jgi:hypothetical protein
MSADDTLSLLSTRELEEAALCGGPAPWWWKNKEGAPWCSLCRRFITDEHVSSDWHVAKVGREEWLAHLPDPIQPAQPLVLKPLPSDQGCLVAQVPVLPFEAHVVHDDTGAHRRIRSPDRDPGGNWIQEWSKTHGRYYFWNDRTRIVAWGIPDYLVAWHYV